MQNAFIADAIRTPIGRYGGILANVRADDLAAAPLRALMDRNSACDWDAVDDVVFGCVNQSGEDNRNVARMALLLAGMSVAIPAATTNRLCGSGLDALSIASRAVKTGESDFQVIGGIESMTRSPFVMPKAQTAFARGPEVHDTTIGWRFVNPVMHEKYGTEAMVETAENVAQEYNISRVDQDRFAVQSQERAAAAQTSGRLAVEITPVETMDQSGKSCLVDRDEHPRHVSLEKLAKLKPIVRLDGTVTAGNASGVNDGAAALVVVSESTANRHAMTPRARIVAAATAGVAPRVMGIGPIPATQKVLAKAGLSIADMDVIELNEAFSSQALAVLRGLGLPDDAAHVNPNGGAIALGHPLGMSGVRLALTATEELQRTGGRYALCTMCIGVGQGIAVILERV